MNLIITWEVEDGYAGPSRIQKTKIDSGELADCDTWEEAVAHIYGCIQDDFDRNISYSSNPEELRADWMRLRSEAAKESEVS